jgi:hypothetical protein
MRRVGPDTYVCTLCNTTVALSGEERPVIMMAAQSGEPNIRIVTVANLEVHRCVIEEGSRTVPGSRRDDDRPTNSGRLRVQDRPYD